MPFLFFFSSAVDGRRRIDLPWLASLLACPLLFCFFATSERENNVYFLSFFPSLSSSSSLKIDLRRRPSPETQLHRPPPVNHRENVFFWLWGRRIPAPKTYDEGPGSRLIFLTFLLFISVERESEREGGRDGARGRHNTSKNSFTVAPIVKDFKTGNKTISSGKAR